MHPILLALVYRDRVSTDGLSFPFRLKRSNETREKIERKTQVKHTNCYLHSCEATGTTTGTENTETRRMNRRTRKKKKKKKKKRKKTKTDLPFHFRFGLLECEYRLFLFWLSVWRIPVSLLLSFSSSSFSSDLRPFRHDFDVISSGPRDLSISKSLRVHWHCWHCWHCWHWWHCGHCGLIRSHTNWNSFHSNSLHSNSHSHSHSLDVRQQERNPVEWYDRWFVNNHLRSALQLVEGEEE